MTETNAMIRTDRLEVIQTLPPDRERRDKAVTAVCGEILSALENRKVELRSAIDVAKQELIGLEAKIKAEQTAFLKNPERFFKNDITEIKAIARKLEWGAIDTKTDLSINDDSKARAELTIKLEKDRYSNGLEIRREVEVSKELKDLFKKKADANKNILSLQVEQARAESQIAKMPNIRMLVEGSVARHDLEESKEGQVLYRSIRSSFDKLIPKELKQLLPA